jgi:hypothetical protein
MLRCVVIAFVAVQVVACGKSEPREAAGPSKEVTAAIKAAESAKAVASPKPPSTGKEMPTAPGRLTKGNAAAELVSLEATVRREPKRCPDAIDRAIELVLVAYPRLDPKDKGSLAAWRFLGECAITAGYWQTALDAAYELLDHGQGEPHVVVLALVSLGELELAREELMRFGKLPGADDLRLGAMAARLECASERYDVCFDLAKLTWKKLGQSLDAPDAMSLAHWLLQALVVSSFFRGEFPEAKRFLDIWEKLRAPGVEQVAAVRKQVVAAELRRVVIEAVSPPRIPLGVYHLYGNQPSAPGGPLLRVKLWNYTGADKSYKVEAEIPGVTERATLTLAVPAGQREDFRLTPALLVALDPTAIRAERPVSLRITVSEGDQVAFDYTREATLLPRDYLPLGKTVSADALQRTFKYAAAWITPNVPVVETFLTAAKARHPDKMFVGEQGATVPQVRALYDELKARGVTYVMDPEVVSKEFAQRTRLPADVLASTNAQCLEGAILFATLMEAAGLRPVLVFVPGHAYVGWHVVEGEKSFEGMLFLETTMVGNAGFADAVDVATDRTVEEAELGSFKRGEAHLLELTDLRYDGITPQPWSR